MVTLRKMDTKNFFSNEIILNIYKNKRRYNDFLDIFNIDGTGKKALDVGCSAGGFSMRLKELGFDVVGIDISEKAIDMAKKLSKNIRYYVADITEWKIKEKFDYIFGMFDLLSFIMKKELRIKALKNMIYMLKKGGKIYFTFIKPNSKTYIKYFLYKIKNPSSEFLDTEEMHFKTKESVLKHNTTKKEIIDYCRILKIPIFYILEMNNIFIIIIKK